MIEHGSENELAARSTGGANCRLALPQRVIRGELGKAVIMDAQQTALLQVRLRHPPSSRQILQQAIFEEIDHRSDSLLVPGTARHWLLHEIFGSRVERAEYGISNAVVRELRRLV